MSKHILGALLGLLVLASSAYAQDPPYYQEQRMVVIFNLSDDLYVTSWDGTQTLALSRGMYRFDAEQKSQAILNATSFADETGPFVRYSGTMRGTATNLSSGFTRDANFRMKLTDVDFSFENIVNAAELTLEMRVQLSSMSSTQTRHSGDVSRSGSFVSGMLDPAFSSQSGQIEVYHVKLALNDDHLPLRQADDFFPANMQAVVTNDPSTDPDWGHEIEAGPWGFTLTRDEQNAAGQMSYDAQANFPMVNESDFYGHYQSVPYGPKVVVQADGNIWLELGWGLSGRYHGWSYTITATLTRPEYDGLINSGSVVVPAVTAYHYGDEDYTLEHDTSAELVLTTAPSAPMSVSLRGEVEVDSGDIKVDGAVVSGMLTEALRALEGEQVTANGVLTVSGSDRALRVITFHTELRRRARAIGGGQRITLQVGTEVEVLRAWGRFARVRFDDNGSPREVTIRLRSVAPTNASGMISGL